MFFCDADEFLNIKFGSHRVDDLLARMQDSQGILVPWRMFGDGGRAHFTGRSIDPAYCRAAATANPNNRVVKTLFRYGPEIEGIGVHVPKMTPEYWTGGRRFLSARLTDIDPDLPPYQKWRHAGQIVTCDQSDTSYDHVQVNHYYARSRACFAMKHRRGVGGVSLRRLDEERRKYERHNYDASNFNDAEDTSILAMLPSLDKAMQSVLSFPTVKAIQDETRLDFLCFEAEFLADGFQG